MPLSLLLCALVVAPVVLFPELAFRLQPLVEVLIQVVTETAILDVNLTRSPTDFVQGWYVLASFFRIVGAMNASRQVLTVRGWVLRFHSLFSFCVSPNS